MSNDRNFSCLERRRLGWHMVVCALTLAGSAGISAFAQSQPKASAPPAAEVQPCAAITDPIGAAALLVAQQRLAAAWLEHGGRFFASYTMAAEQRSPFDRQAGPLMGGRDGVVEAMAPRCLVEVPGDGRTYRFRFLAPYYRFYETATGWSRPLRDGLMLDVSLERHGEAWRELPTGEAPTILVAEQAPRQAKAEQLPKAARWREPFPPCGKGTRWTGTECAAKRRAGSKP